MRGDGLYRRGELWWMSWRTPDGKRHRASTEKQYHEEAKACAIASSETSRRTAP